VLGYEGVNPLRHECDASALRLARPLLEALGTLHGRGFCHGDVKPSNILLRSRPGAGLRAHPDPWSAGLVVPILCDFGLAARVPPVCCGGGGGGSEDIAERVPCGALQYCSPESLSTQLSGGAAGDVWSLGLVLWQVAAGDLHPATSELLSDGAGEGPGAMGDFNGSRASGPDFWAVSEALDALPSRAAARLMSARSASAAKKSGEPPLPSTTFPPSVCLWELICGCLEQDASSRSAAFELLEQLDAAV